VPRRQQAAAEDHRDTQRAGSGQAEPAHDGDRHRGDLFGQPLEQIPRHRVTRRGGLEKHGRQAEEFRSGDTAQVDADSHVADRRQAEVRGRGPAQRGIRAAPVLSADRPPHDLLAEVPAAAPVAAEPPERQEPGGPPVRCHARAVDAGAAGDRDAPGPLAWGRGEPGAQHGERVVGHGRGQGPALAPQRRRELLLFLGQVSASHAARDVPGDQTLRNHAGLCGRFRDDLGEYSHGAVDAEVFLVGAGPADRGKQRAVGGDERHVGLAVPAVDGQHRGQRGCGISQARPPVCQGLRDGRAPRASWLPPVRRPAAIPPCSRPRAPRKARTPRCPHTPRPPS
jgi:hypothetical protein